MQNNLLRFQEIFLQLRPQDRPCTVPRLEVAIGGPKISAGEFVNDPEQICSLLGNSLLPNRLSSGAPVRYFTRIIYAR